MGAATDPSRYKRLAGVALAITLLLLLIPGSVIDALLLQAYRWWPWATPGITSSSLPLDKFVHAGLFAICGALVVRGWLSESRRWLPLYLLLFVYALATEVLQIFVPGRGASVGDIVADAVGAAIGVGLGLLFWRR